MRVEVNSGILKGVDGCFLKFKNSLLVGVVFLEETALCSERLDEHIQGRQTSIGVLAKTEEVGNSRDKALKTRTVNELQTRRLSYSGESRRCCNHGEFGI